MTQGCSAIIGPGGVWHFTGSGYTSVETFAAGDFATALAGTSNTDLWAVGSQRWHYDGANWTLSTPPPAPNDDNSLWAGVGGDYFATGNYIGLYHYTGGTWNLECFQPGYDETSGSQVTGDGQGNYYAATQQGIFRRQ